MRCKRPPRGAQPSFFSKRRGRLLSHRPPRLSPTSSPLPSSAGLNILLISRTESKLKAAAAEIAAAHGVTTDTLAIDFGATLPSSWVPLVSAAVGPLDVGVLVNNVGLSYDHAEYYDALDDEDVNALVAINVQATNHMTKAVLPGMKARRRGAIVCIGSAAATVAPSGPLYAVYAGTKAYVDMFARSLDLECAAWGVSVQNQAPAYVATKMSKIRKPTLDAPSPAVWAAAAARHIGYEPTSVPYWYHGAMWGAVDRLPGFIVNAYLLSFHEWLRARYYKNVERVARGGGAGAAAAKGKKAR